MRQRGWLSITTRSSTWNFKASIRWAGEVQNTSDASIMEQQPAEIKFRLTSAPNCPRHPRIAASVIHPSGATVAA